MSRAFKGKVDVEPMEERRQRVVVPRRVVFEEVSVGEHSLEYTPGGVGMFELVGIERSMCEHGYPSEQKASGSKHHEAEGNYLAENRLCPRLGPDCGSYIDM